MVLDRARALTAHPTVLELFRKGPGGPNGAATQMALILMYLESIILITLYHDYCKQSISAPVILNHCKSQPPISLQEQTPTAFASHAGKTRKDVR